MLMSLKKSHDLGHYYGSFQKIFVVPYLFKFYSQGFTDSGFLIGGSGETFAI